MPNHIPALATRAAVVASTSAVAALLAVLPAVPAAAAPALPATVSAPVDAALSTHFASQLAMPAVAPVALAKAAPAATAPAAVAPAVVAAAAERARAVAAASPSAVTASAMAKAMSKIGSPYVYGAAGPGSFDCSGLMQWAYKQVGMTLPRVAAAQASVGTRVAKADLRPGDLVFFYAPISHVAMYIGNGNVVHASTSGQPVKISPLANMPFATARRI